MSLSLFIGSIALGMWMDLGFGNFLNSILNSVGHPQTIGLNFIVVVIIIISTIMNESGHMSRLVQSFSPLSKNARTVGAVMSALIGLLPMPGGALFSAPMVETSLSKTSAASEVRTALNFWFRHIWEYWWPLYPGVILAVALLEVETWQFMAFMFPMTLVSGFAGIFFILRHIEKTDGSGRRDSSIKVLGKFIWEIMPIIIVVLMIMILAVAFYILELFGVKIKIHAALSIIPGLIASMMWVCFVNRISFAKFRNALLNKTLLNMLLLVTTIMIFKGIINDSEAVLHIRNELMAFNIPVLLVVIVMPFISGLITGIAIGFVGTSFPLIIPLLQSSSLTDYLSFAALAYSFGYMGMMVSPVHVCLLVSKDYFNASLLNCYRYLILPVLTVMIFGIILYSIIIIFN